MVTCFGEYAHYSVDYKFHIRISYFAMFKISFFMLSSSFDLPFCTGRQ